MIRLPNKKMHIAATVTLALLAGSSCSNQAYDPEVFLKKINEVNDSIAYHSDQWNAAAGQVLKNQTEVDQFSAKRKAYSDYLARAKNEISSLASKNKYSDALKEGSLQFIQNNQRVADTFSLRIEALPNEKDSLAEKAYLLVYESQKLNADLEDAFLQVKTLEQIFILNEKNQNGGE